MQVPPAPPPPRPRTSGFAIASLVLGIIGGVVLSLVFGYIALSQIKKSGGTLGGRGLALAGVTLGWAWLALIAIGITLAVVSDPKPVPPGTICAMAENEVVTEVPCSSESAELYLAEEHPPGTKPEGACPPLTAYYTVRPGGIVECWRWR